MGRRDNLRYIVEKDILCKSKDIDMLNRGLSIIDSLPDSDINDILRHDRRDGVASRLKSKLKGFF